MDNGTSQLLTLTITKHFPTNSIMDNWTSLLLTLTMTEHYQAYPNMDSWTSLLLTLSMTKHYPANPNMDSWTMDIPILLTLTMTKHYPANPNMDNCTWPWSWSCWGPSFRTSELRREVLEDSWDSSDNKGHSTAYTECIPVLRRWNRIDPSRSGPY